MTEDSILVQRTIEKDVAYLTLSSPPYNILTCAMMDELRRHLAAVAADSSVKAVALTAEGKAFSAGADVGEHRPEQAPALMASFCGLFRDLDELQVPLIVAADGAALGAGFELAIMADVLLASERATFGQPEIRLGFLPPVGIARLPHLVGPARAAEIVCGGRTYSAAEMQAMGLVRQVLPPEQLEDALESVLKDLRRSSPLILRMNLRLLKRLCGQPFPLALAEAERVFLDELMATEDVREGIASFFEKRKPEWRNR
jgi:cyclohexa-1,5-dienecarbonyl-CoA hydratase